MLPPVVLRASLALALLCCKPLWPLLQLYMNRPPVVAHVLCTRPDHKPSIVAHVVPVHFVCCVLCCGVNNSWLVDFWEMSHDIGMQAAPTEAACCGAALHQGCINAELCH